VPEKPDERIVEEAEDDGDEYLDELDEEGEENVFEPEDVELDKEYCDPSGVEEYWVVGGLRVWLFSMMTFIIECISLTSSSICSSERLAEYEDEAEDEEPEMGGARAFP